MNDDLLRETVIELLRDGTREFEVAVIGQLPKARVTGTEITIARPHGEPFFSGRLEVTYQPDDNSTLSDWYRITDGSIDILNENALQRASTDYKTATDIIDNVLPSIHDGSERERRRIAAIDDRKMAIETAMAAISIPTRFTFL